MEVSPPTTRWPNLWVGVGPWLSKPVSASVRGLAAQAPTAHMSLSRSFPSRSRIGIGPEPSKHPVPLQAKKGTKRSTSGAP